LLDETDAKQRRVLIVAILIGSKSGMFTTHWGRFGAVPFDDGKEPFQILRVSINFSSIA